MKKEIFSWAALENCRYDIQKLKEKVICCRCGTQINEAGFLGYKEIGISWLDHQFAKSHNRENLLIEYYQFLHSTCEGSNNRQVDNNLNTNDNKFFNRFGSGNFFDSQLK